MRKPTGKLFTELDDAQQARLADELLAGMTYHRAQEFVEKQFGLKLDSLRPFHVFWDEVCVPLVLRKRRRSVALAEAVGAELAQQNPGWDAPTLDAVKQAAFEVSKAPDKVNELVKLCGIIQRAQDSLIRDKVADTARERMQFDAAQAALKHAAALKAIAANSTLTDRQKIDAARVRLFGSAPA